MRQRRVRAPSSATARRGANNHELTGDLFAPVTREAMLTEPSKQLLPMPALVPVSRRTLPPLLWLALQFPDLSLMAIERRHDSLAQPRVVVSTLGAHGVVVALNAAARTAGIVIGMSIGAAQAQVAVLDLCVRDQVLEMRELEQLAHWARCYTSWVSLAPPNALLLEVQGSLGLFGGAQSLLERIQVDTVRQGNAVRLGIAPTARAALWLAQGANGSMVLSRALLAGVLGRLPVTVTGWPSQVLNDCARLGITDLADLYRLPRAGLSLRLTPQRLAELDEAYGRYDIPRRRYVVRERFRGDVDLLFEAENSAALLPYCERLLIEMERFLRVRGAGVARIVLLLRQHLGKSQRVPLGRSRATACAKDWQSLLCERLAREQLHAPVVSIGLRSDTPSAIEQDTAVLPEITDTNTNRECLVLLDTLIARLGSHRVHGLKLLSQHRPEMAWRAVAPVKDLANMRLPVIETTHNPRPIWLLSVPQPLSNDSGIPQYSGPLRLTSELERIESGWWDGCAIARDYYRAVTSQGVYVWVFREHQTREWFLHGIFG